MTDGSTGCSIPCNLCGSTDVEQVSDTSRDGSLLRSIICRNCGLSWTDPRPNESEIARYYSSDYRVQYKGTYTPKLKHVYRAGRNAAARYRFLKEFVRPGCTVLDVGSGGGEFVYLMRALGFDARGIEPNEGYGNYARDRLNLPVEIGMLQQFDLPPASIDVVTLHHVFEHLDDPSRILTRLHNALKDGGMLVVEVPNIEGRCYSPCSRFHTAHLYNFNRETLEAMGKKAGFNVRRSIISSDGGVITTIFEKSDAAVKPAGIPGNYERVMGVLRAHTSLSHFLTPYPYLRPVQKLWAHTREMIAVRGRDDGTKLLEQIVWSCRDDQGRQESEVYH
jgi:2-polyprenyl-3-methyl-5-hydroxy-6-metoxy-1,4-benzoquinol methylase